MIKIKNMITSNYPPDFDEDLVNPEEEEDDEIEPEYISDDVFYDK